ncbi:MAG: 3-dehydroquinate synthase [Cardiobacteriaceae bacterium]|nr:3-dehydroquinate synthase [Cardiobacteriaceae bacterium]
METLDLRLPDGRGYPIVIDYGLYREQLPVHVPHKQVCIVSNETVAPLYLDEVKQALAGRDIIEVILQDGEAYKNMAAVERILDALVAARFNRDAVVMALGGGVVGDIAGFAAACYQRGVDFVQLPTTLLAQVDSSVGGKTGVNHPRGKNMIGAFHQPRAVLIDSKTLETLPPREMSAGMAEVIKYALINDAPFFAWLEEHLDSIMAFDHKRLAEVIARCCANKAAIVAADERESGQRALLNLGHTFGHALETLTGYTYWKHGEAIAIGMHMAARLAEIRGRLSGDEVGRIVALMQRARLPVWVDYPLGSEEIYAAMGLDKKVRDGKMRLIVPEAFGQSVIVDDVPRDAILQAIGSVILKA